MRHAIQSKPDPAVAGLPDPTMWVLAQVSPKFEVLAASANRDRLVSEMAELYGCDNDRGMDQAIRFVIRATNRMLS